MQLGVRNRHCKTIEFLWAGGWVSGGCKPFHTSGRVNRHLYSAFMAATLPPLPPFPPPPPSLVRTRRWRRFGCQCRTTRHNNHTGARRGGEAREW